jgi:threonine synthase
MGKRQTASLGIRAGHRLRSDCQGLRGNTFGFKLLGKAKTWVFGNTVPKALGDFLVLNAIYTTDGFAIAVSDNELLEASALLARTEGTFICPEGAAHLSAAIKLRESGWIKSDEHVILLNTGSGLKYPETVTVTPPVLLPGDKLPVG